MLRGMPHVMKLLLNLFVTGVSVLGVAAVLPGMRVKKASDAMVFAFVVAVLDTIAWHYLSPISVLFSIFTFGVGVLIINGLIFLVAQKVVRGVEISGCFVAAIASVLVSLVSSAIGALLR